MSENVRLPRRKRRKGEAAAVLALAAGRTVRQAAKAAGVDERTIYRYRQNPAFCREVTKARDEAISRATARLAATSTKAVATLGRLLTAESESVRRAAAVAILDSLAKLKAVDVEQRLERLEQSIIREEKPR